TTHEPVAQPLVWNVRSHTVKGWRRYDPFYISSLELTVSTIPPAIATKRHTFGVRLSAIIPFGSSVDYSLDIDDWRLHASRFPISHSVAGFRSISPSTLIRKIRQHVLADRAVKGAEDYRTQSFPSI